MFEIEYYDKFKESAGSNEVKTRLEFRKKRMDTENCKTSAPADTMQYWFNIFDNILNKQDELTKEINSKLVKKYFKYQAHEKQWKNIDDFIRCHTFNIFSSKQFIDLCIRFGFTEQQAKNKLKNYKRNNKINE